MTLQLKPFSTVFVIGLITLGTASCSQEPNTQSSPPQTNTSQTNAIIESPEGWFSSGQQELNLVLSNQQNTQQAKNIILFIGDGMGVSTVTAGRIFDGQDHGRPGEENILSFEQLPYMGLAKTYNTNQQTPDSAGTMTAMIGGIKTKAGFISINQIPSRGDCLNTEQHAVPSFLEQAEDAGLATGIVSTARITHATPAATYAHLTERNWEGDSELSAEAKAQGCKDIAQQLIEFDHGDGIEVALGGGRRYFLPAVQTDPQTGAKGRRLDGRDLTEEWRQKYTESQYVWNRQQLQSIDAASTKHLLGLFNPSHMSFRADRLQEDAEEPSLMDMTNKALDILEQNPKGYFLMVEAGRIDHGHHAGNAHMALRDTQEYSQTIAATLKRINLDNTLVIVTADHSHTLTLAGYPTRGNPILGQVISNDEQGNPAPSALTAADGKTFTTLGYRNGPGADNTFSDGSGEDETKGTRKDLVDVDTLAPDYQQQALVPLSSETHAGEDVAIYAGGPWAHLFQRTHEQHYIYHVMWHAAQLDQR